MTNKTKDIIVVIITGLAIVVGFLIVLSSSSNREITINIPQQEIEEAKIPDMESPSDSTNVPSVNYETTGNLVHTPYTPTENPYINYEESVIRLILDGDFKEVKIKFAGKVLDSNDYFISFNMNNISGVLNGVRNSIDTLDVIATRELGGVYSNGEDVKITIDLFGDIVLATTKEEFIETKRKSKIISLWSDAMGDPPSVVNFLFAPFSKNGDFGGIQINSIIIEYLCEEGSPCDIRTCNRTNMVSDCFINEFGIQSARDWCRKTKLPGCENIR